MSTQPSIPRGAVCYQLLWGLVVRGWYGCWRCRSHRNVSRAATNSKEPSR